MSQLFMRMQCMCQDCLTASHSRQMMGKHSHNFCVTLLQRPPQHATRTAEPLLTVHQGQCPLRQAPGSFEQGRHKG